MYEQLLKTILTTRHTYIMPIVYEMKVRKCVVSLNFYIHSLCMQLKVNGDIITLLHIKILDFYQK